jgi:hypothetical protein
VAVTAYRNSGFAGVQGGVIFPQQQGGARTSGLQQAREQAADGTGAQNVPIVLRCQSVVPGDCKATLAH